MIRSERLGASKPTDFLSEKEKTESDSWIHEEKERKHLLAVKVVWLLKWKIVEKRNLVPVKADWWEQESSKIQKIHSKLNWSGVVCYLLWFWCGCCCCTCCRGEWWRGLDVNPPPRIVGLIGGMDDGFWWCWCPALIGLAIWAECPLLVTFLERTASLIRSTSCW